MAGGAAGRRVAALLVVVLTLWPACGCSRVRQWREARASAAVAAIHKIQNKKRIAYR